MAVIECECGARRSAHAHRTSPCRSSARRYWRWLVTVLGAQADGSSIIRARSDLHQRSWCLLRMTQLTVNEFCSHKDMRWDLNSFEHNSRAYLQLLEVNCNPRNWRNQRKRMKLWTVDGLYKYYPFGSSGSEWYMLLVDLTALFSLIDWLLLSPLTMFQHNKKCFTIESLVGKDSSSAAADEPIRPTALRFTESIHPSPFGSCFQNSGRTLYSSNPEMMFTDPATHSTNPGLSLRHLQIPAQPFFSPHQRDTLNFYPWVLRNRYLGHRFQGEDLCSVMRRQYRNIETSAGPWSSKQIDLFMRSNKSNKNEQIRAVHLNYEDVFCTPKSCVDFNVLFQ